MILTTRGLSLFNTDKKQKISKYDAASKGFVESDIEVPAFGITLSKGKGNSIKIALDPGEVELVKSMFNIFIEEGLVFLSSLMW